MVRWKQKVKSLKENSQGFNKKRHDRREKRPSSGSTQRWLTQIFVVGCLQQACYESEQHKSHHDWKQLFFSCICNSMLNKTLALLAQGLSDDAEMVENV